MTPPSFRSNTPPRAALLAFAYVAFISLGLPDAVLGVAWPSLRETFSLSQSLLGLPLALSATAYFCSGLLAGRLIDALGVGRLLAGSTALVAAGVVGYAVTPWFGVILVMAVLIGFGSGAIDAALNSYAAKSFSARHMSWLHAAYAAGAMTGPAIMTAVLGAGASWRLGYGVVGGLLALLVPLFFAVRRLWNEGPPAPEAPLVEGPLPAAPRPMGTFQALGVGRVWLQIGIFFVYTGLEMAAGQWAFTVLVEQRGMDTVAAGSWASLYWGGLLAGRLVLGFAVEWLGTVRVLRLATVGALASTLLFALTDGPLGAFALPLLSFSLASIYPGLMSETPRRLGPVLTPHAVGFQVSAATLGVAAIPSLAGILSQRFGLGAVAWTLVACAVALVAIHERLVRIGVASTADHARD